MFILNHVNSSSLFNKATSFSNEDPKHIFRSFFHSNNTLITNAFINKFHMVLQYFFDLYSTSTKTEIYIINSQTESKLIIVNEN